MPDSSPEALLLAELRTLYKLPPDAVVAELNEPVRTYVTYAMGSLDRGKAALERVRMYRSLEGIRYLDVGCAYGGFCAAAARVGAAEVAGFDVDTRLVGIARNYLRALGVPARIEEGDVTDLRTVAQAGTFDVITCNDVIEHVDSIYRCIANLASALNEGGVLYMAIPNRRATMLIRSDPHFHLFGIVLLSGVQAVRYHTIIAGTDHYDVGEYYEFDDYEGILREQGLEVDVANMPTRSAHWCIKEMVPDFAKLREENETFDDPRLPEGLKVSIRAGVRWAVESFEHAVSAYRSLPASGEHEKARLESLRIARDFYLPTWYVVARKPRSSVRAEGGAEGG